MVSEKDFFDKAKRLMELHLKLSRACKSGHVRSDVLLKYRAGLGGRVSELRREHLELIRDKMLRLEAGLMNIASMSVSIMSEAAFTSMNASLEYQKSSLKAEASKVETATEAEYLALLKSKLDPGNL